MKAIILVFSLCILASNLEAKTSPCKNTIQLGKYRQGGILYKAENIHGSRGATLIIQDIFHWDGPKKKKIYDSKCKKIIGSLGLWALDWPYGERYYTRTGGSRDSGDSLAAKAYGAARSPGGIIIIDKTLSVRVKDFRKEEGFVRNP